jgi:hypothetical protein
MINPEYWNYNPPNGLVSRVGFADLPCGHCGAVPRQARQPENADVGLSSFRSALTLDTAVNR